MSKENDVGIGVDGSELYFHSSGSFSMESMPVMEKFYQVTFSGIDYQIQPQEDITPYELYHLLRLKDDITSNYPNHRLTEYLEEQIEQYNLWRHFVAVR